MNAERKLWVPRVRQLRQSVDNGSVLTKEMELKAMMANFSEPAPQKSLWQLCCNSLVVGQEFALSCFVLAAHRRVGGEMMEEIEQDQWRQIASILSVCIALLTILRYTSNETLGNHPSPNTLKARATDAILLAGILRLLSSVLKTLTASYSTDTVHALATAGMVVHLLFCDYSYANGRQLRSSSAALYTPAATTTHARRPFLGGTFSLNAALFSTTLLASRLSSNSTVYVFLSSSVIFFAFYPAARHAISKHSPHAPYISFAISCAFSFLLWMLLRSTREKIAYLGILSAICWIAPLWRFYLQSKKVVISGPWDIAHIVSVETR